MTSGDATAKENRKPVLSQLIAVSETLKYSAELVETGANVSHCRSCQHSSFQPADRTKPVANPDVLDCLTSKTIVQS